MTSTAPGFLHLLARSREDGLRGEPLAGQHEAQVPRGRILCALLPAAEAHAVSLQAEKAAQERAHGSRPDDGDVHDSGTIMPDRGK